MRCSCTGAVCGKKSQRDGFIIISRRDRRSPAPLDLGHGGRRRDSDPGFLTTVFELKKRYYIDYSNSELCFTIKGKAAAAVWADARGNPHQPVDGTRRSRSWTMLPHTLGHIHVRATATRSACTSPHLRTAPRTDNSVDYSTVQCTSVEPYELHYGTVMRERLCTLYRL